MPFSIFASFCNIVSPSSWRETSTLVSGEILPSNFAKMVPEQVFRSSLTLFWAHTSATRLVYCSRYTGFHGPAVIRIGPQSQPQLY